MSIHIDSQFVQEVAQRLVQIDSVNPSLAEGGGGEQEISAYCAELLEAHGITVQLIDAAPGRTSVVGTLSGSGDGKSLMLNAHIDTVGVAEMDEPFSGEIRDGKLWGRGAFDMKGSAASCMAAICALAKSDISLAGDVVITLVADEEYESIGMQEVLKHVHTDAAIVTEPTQLQICLAHKGFIWYEIDFAGRAAHGSRYELGIDANMNAGRFLARVYDYQQDLQAANQHPLLGPPSLHAAMISGGSGISTYADQCKLHIERRTIPGENEATVTADLQSLLTKLNNEDPTVRAEWNVLCVRNAFEVSRNAGIVQTLAGSCETFLKETPAFVGDTPWMDAAFLSAAGIETVVFGASGGGAHAREEWVELDSLQKLARILADTAKRYCQ